MLAKIATATARLVEEAASVIGVRHATEEPHYEVELAFDGVEIRRYGPRIAAETTVVADDEIAARSAGFRRLAGYIFGGNQRKAKIAMTAPVAQQPGVPRDGQKIAMTAPVAQTKAADGRWMIRFFMPAEHSMETLPAPRDPAVTLTMVPAETYAVRRFNGSRSADAVASQTDQLLKTLENTDYQPAGAPVAWFYDPPWTIPVLRRNEVAVPVMNQR